MKAQAHPLTCLLVGALLGAGVGCDRATVQGARGAKLTITAPGAKTLERGKMTDVNVSVGREELSGPVEITVSQLPAGVNAVKPSFQIPSTEREATFTLHADPNADLVTNHRALVTASAGDVKVSEQLEITIK